MTKTTRITRSDAEWRARLDPEAYRVGVKDGTERAFTPGNFQEEKRAGIYHCKGCGTPLWSSEHKFESGTGWPSYWQPIDPAAIGTSTDFKMIYPRTECHCATCGLHQGHVFRDGPPRPANAGASTAPCWISALLNKRCTGPAGVIHCRVYR